jgi:hypothetical protein
MCQSDTFECERRDCGLTSRSSGRALRPEIGGILERHFVPSAVPISIARR